MQSNNNLARETIPQIVDSFTNVFYLSDSWKIELEIILDLIQEIL